MKSTTENSSKTILKVLLALSLAFIAAAFFAGDLGNLIPGFIKINTSPSQFTMDYFVLGGLGSAFLNCGAVGLACCALLYFSKANCTGLTIAAWWLCVGFATFGMTLFSIWPFFLGVWVYSRIKKVTYGSVVNMAMFSAAVAPFAGELMFRYPGQEAGAVSVIGILGAAVLGIFVGCVMPSLCAHMPNVHKGYDLYSAGPAAGFLAFFLFCVLYKSPGIAVPSNTNLGEGERLFVTVFFILFFGACIVAGLLMDKNAFQDYKKLWKCSGYKTDFTAKFGIPATLVNMGVYGLFILLYFSVVHGMTIADGELVFTSAKFTGATMGAIMCMHTFSAHGAQPRTVFPILVGYAVASFLPFILFAAGVTETQGWTLTTQGILVGACFASGLAPIAGKWGFGAGVVAGAMHAILVTSVPLWHGGFCLYNGGFTAGIVAVLLVPVLECYCKMKVTEE